MWKTINYEVRGRGHEKNGLPCQDRTLTIHRNGVTVIALADGAGSAKHSEIGAQTTVIAVSNLLAEQFTRLIQNNSGAQVKQLIEATIQEALTEQQQALNCEYKDLASTLLTVAIKDDQFIVIHVGDGVIGYIKNDELLVASSPENGEFANTTVFVTSSSMTQSMKLLKGQLKEITGFVLMSDGTAESFYHKQTKSLAAVLKKFVAWTAILTKDKMTELVEDSFEKVIRMKTQDDCSIAIVTLADSYQVFANLEDAEKLNLLEIRAKRPTKQLKRYNAIFEGLQQPKTLKQIAKYVHLKPKFLKRKLNFLLKKGLIMKENNVYMLNGVVK